MSIKQEISKQDWKIISDLAKKVKEYEQSPENAERKRLWLLHAKFQGERPMVLAEHGGVPDIVPKSVLKCAGEVARNIEMGLRDIIFRFEEVRDDHVISPYMNCQWQVTTTGYGVEAETTQGASDGNLFGSYRWEPPIKDLDRDLDKLKQRTYSVDREATARNRAELEELWDGIFPVRMRGQWWWTTGMTWQAIHFIGLEQLMMAMVDNPAGLHRLMQFLHDDVLNYALWLEREKLLSLNNEDDYVGSGGEGWTHELPQKDYAGTARLKDLWVLAESQETVGVGPAMFGGFIFPYQLDIAKRFGLCYYGCCEPVHSRWHILQRLPNLRRVSVSPWCNQKMIAESCGNKVAFARKPNPALISTPAFDEDAMRQDIRETLEAAKGCAIEFSMKDVHNLCNEPNRLGRWVDICRDEIARKY